MGLTKLISLGVMGTLGWQQQDLVMGYWERIKELKPKAETAMEMESFRPTLRTLHKIAKMEGSPFSFPNVPPDCISASSMQECLELLFDAKDTKTAGVDYFDMPYLGENGPKEGNYRIISCGPDQSCGSDDDIVVNLYGGSSQSKKFIDDILGNAKKASEAARSGGSNKGKNGGSGQGSGPDVGKDEDGKKTYSY